MIAKFSRKFIQLTLFVLRKTWHKKSTPFPLPKSKFEERNTTEVRSGSSDFWWNYFQTECHNEISIYTHLFVWNKTSSCIVLTIKTLRKKNLNMTNSLYWCSCLWNTKGSTPKLQISAVHQCSWKVDPFPSRKRNISDSGLLCCDTEQSLCQYHCSDATRFLRLYRKSGNFLCKVWFFYIWAYTSHISFAFSCYLIFINKNLAYSFNFDILDSYCCAY